MVIPMRSLQQRNLLSLIFNVLYITINAFIAKQYEASFCNTTYSFRIL